MATEEMSHKARMQACLAGETLDRPPVALWRHFPVDDQTPVGLASATAAFQREFDFDFVKVTPSSSYCLKDWGVQDEWRGAPEGTREYTRRVVHEPEDWGALAPLDPGQGHLADQLQCLRLLVEDLGLEVPVIQTIFNPLAQAKNLAGGDRMVVHLRRNPEALHAGLRVITESTRRFLEASRDTGIAGIFYAVQHARYGLLSAEEYQTFGRAYDLEVLRAAQDAGFWLNVLHLHGAEIMFDLCVDYPVEIMNWHDQETPPSLKEAQERFPGVVCGGLRRWETVVLGTPQEVRSEARAAMDSTGGSRFVLGTGCVTPIIAPRGNVRAARKAVET